MTMRQRASRRRRKTKLQRRALGRAPWPFASLGSVYTCRRVDQRAGYSKDRVIEPPVQETASSANSSGMATRGSIP